MADNAAQSIKDLQKNIDDLDKKVETAVNALAEYEGHIGSVFAKIRDKGIASTDQVVDYFVKKLKTLSVKGLAAPLEDLFGLNDQKAADEAVKYTEEKNKKQLEIERAYNEREMQLSEEREKQELQAAQAYAKERENLLKLEAKKREDIEKAWAQYEKQQAASSTDLNALGNLAATKGLTGNLASLKDNSALKRYAEERKKIARETAAEEAKASKAIQQQIQYYRQLHTLYKGYKDLQAKPNKTKEDIAILEQTKQKILEILRLSKQLELENKGSRQAGINATNFQRLADNLRNATKETKTLKANLNNLLPTLQRLASAFGVAFSVRGLAQFGKKLIETRGEFERQQVALRSILQNKQLADEIWDKTMQAALQSPFTAMQLTTYTKQLAAYRIETDKLFDTTKRLADVSAGLGVDMQRLILAYGQVKAANYLRASEIRQFTEAGVNVLGELRDYFNDIKGMSVDTAQVMEMVTKRLVTFEDVEAIFKRMTDQGGIFYEMQYVQSQTVRGQIAKLHDAYDQMLNSTGQANEGVLKNMVSLLNSIIKNWQEWKTVLDLIAWPLLISFVYKFSRGLMTTATASRLASAEMSKVVIAGAKTKEMFTNLFATIAKHPFIALGAAVASVGVALLNHAKHVRDINKRYEDLMLRTYETQKNLNGLSETIQKNLDTMNEATKGSEEYNEASRENENIVKKLKDQYPELLQDIDLQKEGYGKLIEKINEYNEELENQIRLEYAARAGFWQDDLTTNIADLQESQRAREMQFLRNREKAEKNYIELKAKGKEAEEDEWDARIRNAKTWQEQYDILIEFARTQGARSSGYKLPIGLSAIWGRDVETRTKDLEKNIENEALVYNDIIRDQLKTINEDLGDDIQQFLIDNEDKVNELFKNKEGEGWKILNRQITKFFTAKGVTDKETRKVIQDFMNKLLIVPIELDWDSNGNSSGNQNPPPPKPEKTKESASKLISLIREMRSEYDKLSKSAYGYAKSEEKVRESYKDSVKEILGRAGITDYDFTTNEGMIQALEKVKTYATRLGKDAAAEVQKYIDQLEAEIEINAQVRIREDFGREIEEMFKNYELTVELQKINLPEDAAKELFGFDYKSLNDILERTKRFRTDLGEDFDEEDEKVYTNWLNKVENKLFQIRKERAKEYTKYLEQELSERAKLEMQYVKDVSFVEATFQNGEQKTAIIDNLKKNYEQSLKELQWKSFKESDFYVEMMQDLTSMPSEYLDLMMQKLDEWANKADVLSPRALKEVLKAREKVLEAQVALSPVRALNQSLGVIHGFQGDTSRVDENGNQIVISKYIKESRKQLQGIIAERAKSILQMQEELDIQEAILGKIKAQEEIQETLSQLSQRGVGGISITSNAESDLANIDTQIKQQQYWLDAMEEVVRKEGENEEAFARRQRMYEDERKEINIVIELLKQLRLLREQADKAGLDPTANLSANKMGTIANVNRLRKSISDAEKLQATDQGIMSGGYAAWNKAVHGLIKNISSVTGKVKDLGNQFYDTLEAVGVETNAVSDAWMELGNGIFDTITQTLELIPSLITGFEATGAAVNTAMGVIGLIAEAIQLTLMLIKGIAKIHDAKLELEIERQQENIDNLQRAYERLEKQIEKTWSTVSYIRTYREETQNLYEQYEALTNQINAEEAKKNTDKDKLQDYQDKQQEILDTLEEIKQQQIEVFGGIGEDSYRGAAEGFVDAWKSAFLETGDGLQGLQDHFDEFLNDWFVKQATMRYASAALEPVFKMIDDAVDPNGPGGANVVMQELEAIKEWARVNFPQISDTLEEISRPFIGGGEGSLSGLAAGIQGMTEEQANILEAYWNSVRMYTANIDMNVTRIAQILGAGGDNSNPMLRQMELVRENTDNIRSLLNSVSFNGGEGVGIRVYSF